MFASGSWSSRLCFTWLPRRIYLSSVVWLLRMNGKIKLPAANGFRCMQYALNCQGPLLELICDFLLFLLNKYSMSFVQEERPHSQASYCLLSTEPWTHLRNISEYLYRGVLVNKKCWFLPFLDQFRIRLLQFWRFSLIKKVQN